MSFGNLWNTINLLGGILGGGSYRQVVMSCEDEKLTLPVTPTKYTVQTEQDNKLVNILDFGEAQLFGNPKLKRLSFGMFFPATVHNYPFVVGDHKEPSECVAMIEKWKESRQPVRVIITDTPVNLMMAIKTFEYNERDGSHDIYYKISLIEWKDLNTPMANNDKKVDETTGLKERKGTEFADETAVAGARQGAVNAIRRTHDIMDASRRAYGKYSCWRDIADANNLGSLVLQDVSRLTIKKKVRL